MLSIKQNIVNRDGILLHLKLINEDTSPPVGVSMIVGTNWFNGGEEDLGKIVFEKPF
jgi:hypothetical protein